MWKISFIGHIRYSLRSVFCHHNIICCALIALWITIISCGDNRDRTRRLVNLTTELQRETQSSQEFDSSTAEEFQRDTQPQTEASAGTIIATNETVAHTYRRQTVVDACQDPNNQQFTIRNEVFTLQRTSPLAFVRILHANNHYVLYDLQTSRMLHLHRTTLIQGRMYHFQSIQEDTARSIGRIRFVYPSEHQNYATQKSIWISIAQTHIPQTESANTLLMQNNLSQLTSQTELFQSIWDLSAYGACLGVYVNAQGEPYSGGYPLLLLPTFQEVQDLAAVIVDNTSTATLTE